MNLPGYPIEIHTRHSDITAFENINLQETQIEGKNALQLKFPECSVELPPSYDSIYGNKEVWTTTTSIACATSCDR